MPNSDGFTRYQFTGDGSVFVADIQFSGPGEVGSWVAFNPQPDPPGDLIAYMVGFGDAQRHASRYGKRRCAELRACAGAVDLGADGARLRGSRGSRLSQGSPVLGSWLAPVQDVHRSFVGHSASVTPTPPAVKGRPAAFASSTRSSRSIASASRPDDEPSVPTASSPSRTGVPGGGGVGRDLDARDALARRPAVLHARDDLLPDVAALVEIDAVQEVEVGVVRKGVAIGEIDAALRNAGAIRSAS